MPRIQKEPTLTALHSRPVGTTPRTTRDLMAAQRLLLRIIREHRFGRIENVIVQDGRPLLDQDTKIVRVARLGGESGGTAASNTDDEFELKQPVRDLFDELARLGNGVIIRLEFRHG